MSKRSFAQQGSALHIVIVAILVLALSAALGVIFYQNFIVKKDTTSQAVVEAPTVTTQTARAAFNSAIYALDYADGWKVTSAPIKDSVMGGSTTTITSADGTVAAVFGISEIAVTSVCDPASALNISDYTINETAVTKLTGHPLYLVETIVDKTGGGYSYAIGLTQEGGDTHASIGDTLCNVAQVGQASYLTMASGKVVTPMITAKIVFPKLQDAPQMTAKDMQTIKDVINTDNYKAAVKILESARKE
jgi:hypothetical protein